MAVFRDELGRKVSYALAWVAVVATGDASVDDIT
jgi:hypothetical protein